MFRVRELGPLPVSLLCASALHLGVACLGGQAPRSASSGAAHPLEAPFFLTMDDEAPREELATNARAPIASAAMPVARSAPRRAATATPTVSAPESAPAKTDASSGETAAPELASATPSSDVASPAVPGAAPSNESLGLATEAGDPGTTGGGAGRASRDEASKRVVSSAIASGPRLLRSPNCSDLFSRGALASEALAVVEVSETGTAALSRLLLPNAPQALIGASRKCVERIAFEPARDAEGHARRGVAKLRIRLAPSEG